jgi:hypothetical protein
MTTGNTLSSRAELEGLVRGWIDACVWRQEIHRAETGGIEYLELHEIEKMGRQDAGELDGLLRFADSFFEPKEKASIERALNGSAPTDKYKPIVASAAREIGVPVDPKTVAGRLFERTVLRGYATLLDELRETVAAIPRQTIVEKSSTQPDPFIFTGFWEDFQKYKLAIGVCMSCSSGKDTPRANSELDRTWGQRQNDQLGINDGFTWLMV